MSDAAGAPPAPSNSPTAPPAPQPAAAAPAKVDAPAEAVPAPADVIPATPKIAPSLTALSLDEACRRISKDTRHVEMIAAFHFDETQANRLSDLESGYRGRFKTFAQRPVK